jgi:hypothetical protein
MAVNAPGGTKSAPAPTAKPSTTSTTSTDLLDPADTKSPILDTQDDSVRPNWQPRTGRFRPPDDPNARPLNSDEELTQALDLYQQRLTNILGGNALTLARGGPAVPEGPLSDAQKSDLVRATEDLLRDVPIGKLSPAFAEDVRNTLATQGINRDVSATRLGDLGSIGGDLAKKWANDLREQSPGEFYALGAGAAAAAGYAAWDKGSEGLRALGIRPELRSQVFDPRFTVRGGVDFDPHLKNFSGRVEGDFNTPEFHLSAAADLDTRGRVSAFSTSAAYTKGDFAAAFQATEKNNRLDNASATLLYNTPTFALSAGAIYTAETHKVSGGLEAQWRPEKNLDFGLSATKSEHGDTYIGVGFQQRW